MTAVPTHIRAREIVEVAAVAAEAARRAGTGRWPAQFLNGANRCDDAIALFASRVPGVATATPILLLVADEGQHDLAAALRDLLRSLQLARNWMTVCGHISRDAGAPLSYDRWKADAAPSIDGPCAPLTKPEIDFVDKLRDGDWTFKDSERALDRVGEVSRKAIGPRIEIELEQAVRAVLGLVDAASDRGMLGLEVNEAVRRVSRARSVVAVNHRQPPSR